MAITRQAAQQRPGTNGAALITAVAVDAHDEMEMLVMSVADDFDSGLIGMVKIRIDAGDVGQLLAQGIEALAAESKLLKGFLGAQILVSVDNKTIVILSEWSDRHAWSQSRYDAKVGELTERFYLKSTTIEFETYYRRASFTSST